MTADARTAAMGWLAVAAAAIERAAECAALGQIEMEDEYLRRRAELDAMVREGTYDLQIAQVILERLDRERERAGEHDGRDGRAA